MVAYTQSLCGVIWMGHDDGTPLPLGIVGGGNPAHMLAGVFARYPDRILPDQLPDGLVRVALDRQALRRLQTKIAPADAAETAKQWELFRESAFASLISE